MLGTNAPAENIIAESILGWPDHMMKKGPNASDSYVSSKTSFAMNKTFDRLKSMHVEGRIPKAIVQARAFRSQSE